MKEVRWHGRGGQGAKTASQILALATMRSGHYVQAFPEYGPERSGAPMQSYNRSDQHPIRRRSGVTQPDVVVVLDPSLLDEVPVALGLKREGLMIVNTDSGCDQVRAQVGYQGRILCVPATRLASSAGTRFPSVVMLGALAGATGQPPLEAEEQALHELLATKLPASALAATIAALQAGYRAGGGDRVGEGVVDG